MTADNGGLAVAHQAAVRLTAPMPSRAGRYAALGVGGRPTKPSYTNPVIDIISLVPTCRHGLLKSATAPVCVRFLVRPKKWKRKVRCAAARQKL